MNEYWRQREEQAQREYRLTEEEYIEELNGIYDYMLDRINEDIRSFYSRYATREGITYAEATERVSNTVIEEYERKAKKYVEEHDFSAQANEEMRIYNLTMRVNRLETLKAEIGLEMVDGFNELDAVLGEDLTERAVQEMARQSGILGMTVKDTARTANSIVGASFHNATFSERIWMYQDELKSQLDILLRQGLIQGRGPRELADQILRRFDVSRNEAERLMRTELCRVQTEAQKQSFIANGFDEYQYNALSTACPVCRALDEKHFKIVDMMPGENAPPMHPNCFCATSAYMDDATYNEWLDTYQNHGMSFEDWLENRPTAVEPEEEEPAQSALLDEVLAQDADRNYTQMLDWYTNDPNLSSDERDRMYVRAQDAWEELVSRNVTDEEWEQLWNYIGSTESFDINNLLRANPNKSISEILSGEQLETAQAIESAISKNTLSSDTLLTRYLYGDALEDVFGIDENVLAEILDNFGSEEIQENVFQNLIGQVMQENGYISTSGNRDLNQFRYERNVRLDISAPSGTHALVTDNEAESEVILDRGTKYIITGFDRYEVDPNYDIDVYGYGLVIKLRIVE